MWLAPSRTTCPLFGARQTTCGVPLGPPVLQKQMTTKATCHAVSTNQRTRYYSCWEAQRRLPPTGVYGPILPTSASLPDFPSMAWLPVSCFTGCFATNQYFSPGAGNTLASEYYPPHKMRAGRTIELHPLSTVVFLVLRGHIGGPPRCLSFFRCHPLV
jgi:hypothetical protein